MAEAASAVGAPKVTRLDRRKARTRQALIDAAVRLIAEGRGDRASIAEITEEADIGFGSCRTTPTRLTARWPAAPARALDSGQLGIVVLDAPGDSPLPPGRPWSAPRLEVHAPAPVHAGIYGEAVDLDPPLRFASRPASLRVRISPRHPGASPSARLHLPSYPPDLRGGGDG